MRAPSGAQAGAMLGWELVARWRRALWSHRRVHRRLARFCQRSRSLDDLWRGWCGAGQAERARFLAEVEDRPY